MAAPPMSATILPSVGTELSIEVFLFDFDENIYEKFIRVYFLERLRDEKRFSGPEELAAQIRKDVEKAKGDPEREFASPFPHDQ